MARTLGITIGLTVALLIGTPVAPPVYGAEPYPPVLRGVNFSGMNFTPGQQWPVAPAVDYFLVQKKMNLVRFNLCWELVQPTLDGDLDAGQVKGILEQINRITAAGGYTQIELHNDFRRLAPDGQTYIVGETPHVTADQFADVWRRLATRFSSNPKVIFELDNEPHDQDTRVLMQVQNAAVAAIRATGARNLIVVTGNNWSQPEWFANADNQAAALSISDPLHYLAFAIHHYFDVWSAGQSPNIVDNTNKGLASFTTFARAHHLKGLIGEFGASYQSRAAAATTDFLSQIEGNSDVYLGWAWWGGGGWWQPDYIYLLDPFASRYSATNPDQAGSITWANPVDRPQMKVLQQFLPKTATPFNGWLIEADAPHLALCLRRGNYNLNGVWTDASAAKANAAQETAAKRPTQQSDGGVAFTAAGGQSLTVPLSAANGNEAAYAMVSFPATSAGSRTILGAANNGARQVSVDQGGGVSVHRQGVAVKATESVDKVPTGAVCLVQEGLVTPARADAQNQLGTGTGLAPSGYQDNSAFPASTSLLGSTGAGTEGLNGALYDLVVFSENLSAGDNAKVQGRLYWDLGLAYRLPHDHPYYSRPPSK